MFKIILLLLFTTTLMGFADDNLIKIGNYWVRPLTKDNTSHSWYDLTFTDMQDRLLNPVGKLDKYSLDSGRNLIIYIVWKMPNDKYLLSLKVYNESNIIIDRFHFYFQMQEYYYRTWFKRKYNANIAPGRYRFEITLNNYVLGNEYIDFVSTNTNINPTGASSLILSKEDQISSNSIITNKMITND